MEPRLTFDPIPAADAGTLPGLFLRRCEKTPDAEAYRQFDPVSARWERFTWRDMRARVARWRAALAREGLPPGARVAILAPNGVDWVCCDLAALSLGLVVVPLYVTDTPDSLAWLLADAGARLLLVGEIGQWQALEPLRAEFPQLARVLCLRRAAGAPEEADLRYLNDWLPRDAGPLVNTAIDPHALATLVYTSGTTGRPKGVMLSHRNILWNAEAVLKLVPGYREDVYLSFLPLSHTFERTVGYYLPIMTGSTVAYARSVRELPEDLLAIRPSVLVSVPRVYERIHARIQAQLAEKGVAAQTLFRWAAAIGWRRFEASQGRGAPPGILAKIIWPLLRHLVADKLLARLGGRLRLAVSGGAPLFPNLAHDFIGLGLPLVQGYGLTETAPIVSANRLEDNIPESVGLPLPGVELTIGDQDELLVKSPGVMLGYWGRPEDTARAIDADGWLHTGDQARLEANGHLILLGRLKEILVMSSGEKVAPADLEMAIAQDPLFDQALLVGEGMPYVAALLVLNPEAWAALAATLGLDPDDAAALTRPEALERALGAVSARLRGFPAASQVRRVWLTREPWSIDNGLVTPTMKLKRTEIVRRHADAIQTLYAGHSLPT